MTHLSAHRLVHELLTTPDAYMAADDILPALYFLISRRHWSEVAKREHVDVGQAFMRDVAWDGSPMPDDDFATPSSIDESILPDEIACQESGEKEPRSHLQRKLRKVVVVQTYPYCAAENFHVYQPWHPLFFVQCMRTCI